MHRKKQEPFRATLKWSRFLVDAMTSVVSFYTEGNPINTCTYLFILVFMHSYKENLIKKTRIPASLIFSGFLFATA